jgi:hypothetical protein
MSKLEAVDFSMRGEMAFNGGICDILRNTPSVQGRPQPPCTPGNRLHITHFPVIQS